MSLHPDFRRRWLLQVCLGKLPTEIGKSRHRTSVFFCRCASNPRFAQGQPKGYFKWRNLIEQLKPLLEWMLYERWRRLSVQSSTCQHGPTLQFVSRAEKNSLFGTVMMAWIWHVGSMPWCWFPWHKLLTRLAQKNCYKVYSLNTLQTI